MRWPFNQSEFDKRKERFDDSVSKAEFVARLNPNTLFDLIRHLGAEYRDRHWEPRSMATLSPATIWFHELASITEDGLTRKDLKRKIPAAASIDIDRSLNIPTHPEYLADGRSLEYWLPFHICWFNSQSSEFAGQQMIHTTEIYDLSLLFQHVNCESGFPVRRWDGHILAPDCDPDIAALYEVGRLMKHYRLGEEGYSSWRVLLNVCWQRG
jgi:hypothetical protein